MVGNVVDTVGSIIDDHDALFVGRFHVDVIRPVDKETINFKSSSFSRSEAVIGS